jgi:DNA-binding FadR family transcriptional regulator
MNNMKDKKRNPEAPPSTDVDLRNSILEEPEEGLLTAYSNVVNLDWTLYDIRLRFAELMQVPNDESPTWINQHSVLLERVAVRLPWHQAKALRDMLDGVIRNYEAVNGELKPLKLAAAPDMPTPEA